MSHLKDTATALEKQINKCWLKVDKDYRAECSALNIFALPRDCCNPTPNQIIIPIKTTTYISKTIPSSLVRDNTRRYYVFDPLTYSEEIIQTPSVLRELGLNPLQYDYFGININPEKLTIEMHGNTFAIAKDLTERGRYILEDIEDSHLELSNAKQLKAEYRACMNIFHSIYNKEVPGYRIKVIRHNPKDNTFPERAIRRMFQIKIDPTTNTGQLILGVDQDNIVVYKQP